MILGLLVGAWCATGSAAQQSVINVSNRQFILECAGSPAGPLVMLLPGGDGSVEAWGKVKEGVAGFARACSYEPAGTTGSSPATRQTMDDLAADLGGVLEQAGRGRPAILVGHAAGGILARRFASISPGRVAGFILLDSSHEEQMWRFAAIAPGLLDFVFGPAWKDPAAVQAMGLLPRGQRSSWRTDRPLIVIEHGVAEPPPPQAKIGAAPQKELESVWHVMQQDLAARSPRGELRKAEGSPPQIHRYKPEVVVTAIKDMLARTR